MILYLSLTFPLFPLLLTKALFLFQHPNVIQKLESHNVIWDQRQLCLSVSFLLGVWCLKMIRV